MTRALLYKGLLLGCALAAASTGSIAAQQGVAVHGSIQADALFPERDDEIGAETFKQKIRFNTYGDVNLASQYLDAGLRVEFMKWPLPGYEPDFSGWGVPNVYVKGKYRGLELTAGDFYEQFGSGFILRTYEERSLGIDNSIRGGRLKVNSIRGLRLTALGGLQRRYWDWRKQSKLFGASAEVHIDDYSQWMRDHNAAWLFGASYVLKHESDEMIIVPGTENRLNLPKSVGAFDVLTHFQKDNWGIQGEYAWKSQDPSFDNGYTYGKGDALMLTGSYTRKGMSALVQAKRSENMAFRSQRSMSGTSAMVNNMPAFAYQHTYALAAMYPYATQAADGEWAFQGQLAYNFARKTALGGKYGTKVRLNLSYIAGLKEKKGQTATEGSPALMGTNGIRTDFFGLGQQNYHDFNIQIEKRLSRGFQLAFMYMNQFYNKEVVEGHGDKIHTNIFVLDGKYKFDKRFTLRGEVQYLTTKQDNKDWAYGLLELSVAPYVMVSVSDMWNCGGADTHYYMGGISGNYKGNRLMLSYGRTRAGYNCSGGVCRLVPASHGFQINYTYSF